MTARFDEIDIPAAFTITKTLLDALQQASDGNEGNEGNVPQAAAVGLMVNAINSLEARVLLLEA